MAQFDEYRAGQVRLSVTDQLLEMSKLTYAGFANRFFDGGL
jgi:hypothetical protein